jgi:hypothetical protein
VRGDPTQSSRGIEDAVAISVLHDEIPRCARDDAREIPRQARDGRRGGLLRFARNDNFLSAIWGLFFDAAIKRHLLDVDDDLKVLL